MINIAISCRVSSPSFVEQLSKSLPRLRLQSIELTHVETRHRHLWFYLKKCQNTLRALRLAYMTFTKSGDHQLVLNLSSDALKLTSCVLTNINADGNGTRFAQSYSENPPCSTQSQNSWRAGKVYLHHKAEEVGASDIEEGTAECLRHVQMTCTLELTWKDSRLE